MKNANEKNSKSANNYSENQEEILQNELSTDNHKSNEKDCR